jgi:hypothetical protein
MHTATSTFSLPKPYNFDILPEAEKRLLHALVDTLLRSPGGRLLVQDQGSTTAAYELVIGLLRQGDAWIVRTRQPETQACVFGLRFTDRGFLLVSRPEGRG